MLGSVSEHRGTFSKARSWHHLPGQIGKLLRGVGLPEDIRRTCDLLASQVRIPEQRAPDGEVFQGIVTGWHKTFGFIRHPAYPDGVFFPAAVVEQLRLRSGEEVELSGMTVRFSAQPSDHGRPRAEWVSLTEDP